MVAVLWAGCASSSLSDVPIRGGTATERDRVLAAAERFADAVGPDRLRIHRFHIRPLPHALGGRYGVGRTVQLDPEATDSVVYHELCHALVAQDNLHRSDPEPIEEVSGRLFDPDFPYGPKDAPGAHYGTARKRWSEAVAELCEQGPEWPVDVRTTECPAPVDPVDDALTHRVADWLSAEVWRAFTPTGALPVDLTTAVRADLSYDDINDLTDEVAATDDPHVLAVTTSDGRLRNVDLRTGVELASELPPRAEEVDVPPGLELVVVQRAGFADGPVAVLGGWGVPVLSTDLPFRLRIHDDEGWRAVGDGCGNGQQWLFTAGDGIWLAWVDAGLHWVELTHR